MLTAGSLVLLALTTRLLFPAFHLWNFVPIGAIALYSGARLPKRWAWGVPVCAMILSDIVMDLVQPWPYSMATRLTVYLSLVATTSLGLLAKRPKMRLWTLPLLSVGASSLFFVTTNLATWAEGQLYPLTMPGLVTCYIAALAFFKNSVLSDLAGTAILFSVGPVIERTVGRVVRAWLACPRLECNPVKIHSGD